MGKITVKHYLNTNLKPYVINGENYFSIYALVTANRQNTKVKSIAFNEYYTEADFAEIVNPESKDDCELLRNEEQTIINIANLMISEVEAFDTTLFASLYNYYQKIFVFDLDLEELPGTNLYRIEKNKLGIAIDMFFTEPFSIKENDANGMSLYTFFSSRGQSELIDFLIRNNCKIDVSEAVAILNKIFFYRSFDKLKWILKGSKKFDGLVDKYSRMFEFSDSYIEVFADKISI